MEYPEIPCDPPDEGEPGDVWYCPGCARRFFYTLISVEDQPVGEAWITSEIG
jgi:hypothetical protein